MAGATIRLFLPNGDAQSLRVAEISNWNGKALAAPRSEIEGLLDREDESELKGFSCTIKGLTARGQRSAQGFVVFKGSEASAELRPSAKERAPWLISLRDRLIASGVDAVLIAPASHFIPQMLKAAVAAGKHVFCEKPHAIDIPGLALTRTACEEAKQKKLSVVSGLCWRYDPGVRETMKRIHAGQLGDIVAIQETYVGAPYIVRERRPGQAEMEWQLWNWYHFNWLSGDQTAQQLIHSIDLSSALAIGAQIACYTGAILTWDDVMKSQRSFSLPRYGWDAEPPVKPGPDGRYPTAMQGSLELDRWKI